MDASQRIAAKLAEYRARRGQTMAVVDRRYEESKRLYGIKGRGRLARLAASFCGWIRRLTGA